MLTYFNIPKSEVVGKTIDIFGNSGVWALPTGSTPTDTIIKKAKAYIVATFCRGRAHLQDALTSNQTNTLSGNFLNRVWNDYLNKGSNFYTNTPVDLYGKIIHDSCLTGFIDGVTLPYAYALSFDDIWNYSSLIQAGQLGPAPTATSAEILNIDIYTNSNII
jgi:hypothetical protein